MPLGAARIPLLGGIKLDGSTQELAAPSAAYIKQVKPSATSGTYWLYDAQGTTREVYCEMSLAGGGWQHFSVAHSGSEHGFVNFNTTQSWWDGTNNRPRSFSSGTYDKTGGIPSTKAGTYWRDIQYDLKGDGTEGAVTIFMIAQGVGTAYMTASIDRVIRGNNSAVTNDSNFSTSHAGSNGYYMMFRTGNSEDPWINVTNSSTHGSDTASGEYMYWGENFNSSVHQAYRRSSGGFRVFCK